jgi:ureidoglycolate lyase
MRTVRALPLTAAAFAPFGEVLTPPTEPGRVYYDKRLESARPGAWASLSLARIEPAKDLPFRLEKMERHEFSSQSFVPLGPARFLVVVAPQDAEGRPDVAGLQAFVAEGGQGITYGADVWHAPMTVLGAASAFAVFMWNDGTAQDTEFADIEPLLIEAA